MLLGSRARVIQNIGKSNNSSIRFIATKGSECSPLFLAVRAHDPGAAEASQRLLATKELKKVLGEERVLCRQDCNADYMEVGLVITILTITEQIWKSNTNTFTVAQ